MPNFGGDQLARGAKSAQFSSAASISQFEDDLIFRPEIVAEKYGLTEEQIQGYTKDREEGTKLPDLPTVEAMQEMKTAELTVGFNVADRRRFADIGETHPLGKDSKPVAVAVKKWPEYEYEKPRTILDRVLVKRISDDPNLEQLEDGTMRDKRTGFIMPPAYRQHSNMGIVLAIGDFVIMGGVKTPLSDFVKPGDKVKYGDYNSEVYFLSDAEVEKLCDEVQMNFVSDPEGLRVIRVQDIRTIQGRVPVEETQFKESYYREGEQAKNPVLERLAAGCLVEETVMTTHNAKGHISSIVPGVHFQEAK